MVCRVTLDYYLQPGCIPGVDSRTLKFTATWILEGDLTSERLAKVLLDAATAKNAIRYFAEQLAALSRQIRQEPQRLEDFIASGEPRNPWNLTDTGWIFYGKYVIAGRKEDLPLLVDRVPTLMLG